MDEHCPFIDDEEGYQGEEHTCEECGEKCTCDYNPCICCNYDW